MERDEITIEGRVLHATMYFVKKYNLSGDSMRRARNNGLPYIKIGRVYYYNEQDFHKYHAGLIGNDVERKKEQTGG